MPAHLAALWHGSIIFHRYLAGVSNACTSNAVLAKPVPSATSSGAICTPLQDAQVVRFIDRKVWAVIEDRFNVLSQKHVSVLACPEDGGPTEVLLSVEDILARIPRQDTWTLNRAMHMNSDNWE